MNSLSLHQVTTKDGIPLEGLLFEPVKKTLTVAVWFQGLSGRLSSAPQRTNELARILNGRGIALAAFDARGAGLITSFRKGKGKKKKWIIAGTSMEKFEHCVLDIRAVVGFLRKKGYRKIFLVGHSTGANKIAFYYGKTHDRAVNGLALLGPLSDFLGWKTSLKKNYRRALGTAREMMKKGKGNALLPFLLANGSYWSAARFWSNARAGSNEDAFPYYDPKKKLNWAARLKIPVLVLIGGKDQYADRPISDIIDFFQARIPKEYFSGGVIKNADHGFAGKEDEMAKVVAKWIAKHR